MSQREGVDPTCPHCSETENNDHMLCCSYRETLHANLKRSLTSTLVSIHTCPRVQKELIFGAFNALGLQQDNPPSEFSSDYADQSSIGWLNLFRGFIAKGWQRRQEHYARFLTKKQRKTTNVWSSKVVSAFIEASYKIWIERCNNVNDHESRLETAQERRRAEALVRAAYRHRQHVRLSDRDTIFDMPLEERLKQPAKTLLNWHEMIKTTLRFAIKEYAKYLKETSREIPQFFQKCRPPPRRSQRIRRRSSYGTQPAHQVSSATHPDRRRSRSVPRTAPRTTPSGRRLISGHISSDNNDPT